MLKPHVHRPRLMATEQAAFVAPSLYDECLRLLAKRGAACEYPQPRPARLDPALHSR